MYNVYAVVHRFVARCRSFIRAYAAVELCAVVRTRKGRKLFYKSFCFHAGYDRRRLDRVRKQLELRDLERSRGKAATETASYDVVAKFLKTVKVSVHGFPLGADTFLVESVYYLLNADAVVFIRTLLKYFQNIKYFLLFVSAF